MIRHLRSVLSPVACALALAGCQTLHVTTDVENAHLAVEGEEVGVVPAEGVDVDVGLGFGDVPYTMTTPDGRRLEGTLARDDIRWLVVAGAFSGAVILVPLLASAAFVLANPVAINAFAGADPGALIIAQSRPSLFTAPAVAGAIALGLSPLLLLLLGQSLPDEVHIASR